MLVFYSIKSPINRRAGFILYLNHQFKKLQRTVFGSKSERFVADNAPSQFNLIGDVAGENQNVKTERVAYTRKVQAKDKKRSVHLPHSIALHTGRTNFFPKIELRISYQPESIINVELF